MRFMRAYAIDLHKFVGPVRWLGREVWQRDKKELHSHPQGEEEMDWSQDEVDNGPVPQAIKIRNKRGQVKGHVVTEGNMIVQKWDTHYM